MPLEHSADRAQARGGFAAAAAFFERSATLTPGATRRAERALAAAHARCQAGAFDAALGLLAAAEAGPLDELQCARSDLLRGQIAFASRRGSDAPPLLKAARRFEPLDLRLARETYLQALFAALFASSLFISPATVAYHLGKVFAKLGISSRSHLARTLSTQPDTARAAAPRAKRQEGE